MAWNAHPTVVTGQTWSASDQNTYVKGNLDTLFPYTAALQVAYSTSTASLNKATSSAAFLVLRSNSANTAIEFGGVVATRQGSSATNWWTVSTSTTYTTNYTPATAIMQCGMSYVSSGTHVITFPQSFSAIPLVFVSIQTNGVTTVPYVQTASSTGATIVGGSANVIMWLALGPV